MSRFIVTNDSTTRSYRVMWEIDIEATSPEDAAQQARAIQLDPESIATIFLVSGEGAEEEIDTADIGA